MNTMRLFLSTAIAAALSITPVSGSVTCEEDVNSITVHRNGRPVLAYQKTVRLPEGVDPKYGRSGFLHPVSTPSGRVLTDDYPLPDHTHQNGVFLAWRKATFEGKSLNFWEASAATVRHEKVLEILNDKDAAGFRVELAHVDGEEVILREIRTVLVHADSGHIDLTSEQRCATGSPLTLDRYHYGGFAVRGSRQWYPGGHGAAGEGKEKPAAPCQMLTSAGLTRENGNHSRPAWVCMSGPIDGAPASLTVIPHPDNLRHPQHARLHPKVPYFCFLPTVEEPHIIKPGDLLRLRFRLVAADGKPDPAELDKIQRAFAAEKN